MDKKLLKQYINRTGFQRAGIVGSNPLLRGTTGPNQILKAPRGYTGMQEILAGGALGVGASKFLEDEDKENLPVETEETKLPKKEPPEDPDILPELTKHTAEEVIRKEIEDKRIAGRLEELEEVYSQEGFKKANEEYPELSPVNNKKIVEADKHFGAQALARIYGHNSNETQLIYLSPQEYLDLTKGFGPTDGTWSQAGKATIKYLENKIKEGKEIGEIPILFVGKEGENYLVTGQEGRHRAQAFKNQGYDKIPVRIEGSGRDKENDVENKVYTATPKSYLYKEHWAQKYLNFIPKNIISKSNYNKDTKEYEDWEIKSVKAKDFYDVASKEKLFVKEEDPTSNLYKTVNKAQHRFLMDSISEYTENISKSTMDKVNKLLYLNEKVTFTDKQLRELNNATSDKRQLDFDLANKKNWDDVDEDLDLSIKENAEMLNTVTEQEYLDLMQKLKNPKKIEKKAHGGLIDTPLTGGSRYI